MRIPGRIPPLRIIGIPAAATLLLLGAAFAFSPRRKFDAAIVIEAPPSRM